LFNKKNKKLNKKNKVTTFALYQINFKPMKKKIVYLSSLLIIAGTSLFMTACNKKEVTTTPTKTYAKVMVAHASPNAPAVDLLIDNTKINTTGLAFPSNTGYLTVEAGKRNIKVTASGTMTSVIAADLDFTKDKNYSIFAVDSLSKISALVLTDDLTAPAAGKAHVRFVHLSPNAPAVDVAVASSGAVVFGNKKFKESTNYTPLDAGDYNLDVRVAGTSTVALVLPKITLEAGKIYTVFAKGFLGGTGVQALGAEIIVNK
jgi:hypothetical protein